MNLSDKLVKDLALQWHLFDLKPVENISCNYVLSGFQGEYPIVLKLGDINALSREAAALKVFKGQGVVNVLNQTEGAILLERMVPGHSLKQFFPKSDTEAIAIVSEAIHNLHGDQHLNSIGFPTINEWLISLDATHDMLELYLPKARILRDELLKTMGNPILLHGDLHHDNILAHGEMWKVIDPKGVMGELAYEVGCFIRNPMHDLSNHPDCLTILVARVDNLSKNLKLDPIRIIKWSYVQAVLAIIWMLEDNQNPESLLKTLSVFNLLLNRQM